MGEAHRIVSSSVQAVPAQCGQLTWSGKGRLPRELTPPQHHGCALRNGTLVARAAAPCKACSLIDQPNAQRAAAMPSWLIRFQPLDTP